MASRRDLHRLRVRPRSGGGGGIGHPHRAAARELRVAVVQGRRRPDAVPAFWERMTAPDAPFPTTAASSPGDFKDGLRGGLRRRRRGDRVGPRRRHAVGHDQERPDRARHAARPRDPRRRLAERVDGDRASWPGWASRWPPRPTSRPRRSPTTLEERAQDLRIYFALDTLEYLKKGGRISGAQAAIGTLLSVKPIIMLKDGEVETVDRVRTRSKARERLLELTTERPIERLSILHTVTPDVEAFRDGRADARPGPGSGRRVGRARRRVRRAARRPGLRRRGDPVSTELRSPRAARPPADRLRHGCDNLADRYHRAGARRRPAAILRVAHESRVARPGQRPSRSGRCAPWGRPGDDPHRRGGR